jgi:hypothetical protein
MVGGGGGLTKRKFLLSEIPVLKVRISLWNNLLSLLRYIFTTFYLLRLRILSILLVRDEACASARAPAGVPRHSQGK